MSLDARVRYTKAVIQNSFMALLKVKPFSRITLKEVCELAKIKHSTFYRHYKDIFDWKEQLEASIMENLENCLNDFDTSDMKSILISQLQYYQCKKDLFTVIASENFESTLVEKLFNKMFNHAEVKTRKLHPNDSDARLRWNYCFIICGVAGIIRSWAVAGMLESPEDVAAYIMEHLTPYLCDK